MANREVNLTKRIQTPHGMRYCPVVLSANGRVKPDWVHVNDHAERHPAHIDNARHRALGDSAEPREA